jgi:hypothetical protein
MKRIILLGLSLFLMINVFSQDGVFYSEVNQVAVSKNNKIVRTIDVEYKQLWYIDENARVMVMQSFNTENDERMDKYKIAFDVNTKWEDNSKTGVKHFMYSGIDDNGSKVKMEVYNNMLKDNCMLIIHYGTDQIIYFSKNTTMKDGLPNEVKLENRFNFWGWFNIVYNNGRAQRLSDQIPAYINLEDGYISVGLTPGERYLLDMKDRDVESISHIEYDAFNQDGTYCKVIVESPEQYVITVEVRYSSGNHKFIIRGLNKGYPLYFFDIDAGKRKKLFNF